MNDFFSMEPREQVDTNWFDLSHSVKTSMRMGYLTPTCVLECMPGDTHIIGQEMMARMAPLINPILEKVGTTTHFYFVPNRLLWDGWQDFITGKQELAEPVFNPPANGVPSSSLGDYMFYPNPSVNGWSFVAYAPAAYTLIWDTFYRDQNLQLERFQPLVPGANPWINAIISDDPFRVAWNHDYFTSCLPWPQKGDAAIVPLQNANIVHKSGAQPAWFARRADNGNPATGANNNLQVSATAALNWSGGPGVSLDPNGSLTLADPDISIQDLRRSFRLQEFLELDARAGTRYAETIKGHFGVTPSDYRLQRPEYVCGIYGTVSISEVVSTAETIKSDNSTAIPVGYMGGHGIAYTSSDTHKLYCEEHGWLIGISFVKPETSYTQGLARNYKPRTRFEYPWPMFATLGEQEVYVSELYAEGTLSQGNNIFGYIPRYSEYRYMPNRVTGVLKTNLDMWHMARKFTAPPVLNESFIQCDPTDRIFALRQSVGPGDPIEQMYCIFHNRIKSRRKLPMFAIPSI